MKLLFFFLLPVAFVFVGCSDKEHANEKKSQAVTPSVLTHADETTKHTQKRVDTVEMMGKLTWHSNVEEAFTLAKKEEKNLIIMVGEESCRWCMKMKKKTLADVRVQEQMQKYILVSIKRSDKQAIKLVPEFDGNIPSFFFIDNNKELIDSVVGYFNADDFLGYILESQGR